MVNEMNYTNNRRKLNGLRERIREKWIERRNQMQRDLVKKIDIEKKQQEFWKDIRRMMEGKRKIWIEKMKNKTGTDLKTGGEIKRAFRSRLERTF